MGGGGQGADFSDFFSELFGARSPFGGARGFETGPWRCARGGFSAAGQDHVARVEIDLEDAYKGGTRTIDLRTPEMTPDGHVTVKPRTLRVAIPAGVIEGQQIRLAGQGSPGIGGGPAGDLFLEVNFRPHPLFTVDGRDVTVKLPVAPWEAALGETVSVPTLGGPVEMKLPVGARAGQRLRLARPWLAGRHARRPVRRAAHRVAAGQSAGAGILHAHEVGTRVRSACRIWRRRRTVECAAGAGGTVS